jgi:hypothetical protein
LTGSRLGFYLIDTPLPFVVSCPAVVPLHFVTNDVCIDDFVPFEGIYCNLLWFFVT